MLRPSLLVLILSCVTGCSSGISDVAPAGDEDTGATTADTGGTADAGADSTTRDSSTLDASSDTPSIDAGGPDSIVVGDATPLDGAVTTCLVKSATGTSSDCAADEYCDAPDCLSGTCKHRPLSSINFDPVCGCDGVTYWNVQWARYGGHPTKGTAGPCGTSAGTKSCGGLVPKTCPTGGECIYQGTSPSWCTVPSPSGTCWSFPPDTDCSGGSPKKERVCGTGECTSACQSIRKANVFYDDPTCP